MADDSKDLKVSLETVTAAGGDADSAEESEPVVEMSCGTMEDAGMGKESCISLESNSPDIVDKHVEAEPAVKVDTGEVRKDVDEPPHKKPKLEVVTISDDDSNCSKNEGFQDNEAGGHAAKTGPEMQSVQKGEHTGYRSDRSRNKCTSAAVLLGLVKSRVRKLEMDRQKSAAPRSSVSAPALSAAGPKPKHHPVSSSTSAVSVSGGSRTPRSAVPAGTPADWRRPFESGWRREVVHRGVSSKPQSPATSSATPSSRPTADVYYFSPSNVKLRSMPDVIDYLKRTNSSLSAKCFTFAREPIYQEPDEVVRMAGVPNAAGRQRQQRKVPSVAASPSPSATETDGKTDLSKSAIGDLVAKWKAELGPSQQPNSPASVTEISKRGRPRKVTAEQPVKQRKRLSVIPIQPKQGVIVSVQAHGEPSSKQTDGSGKAPAVVVKPSDAPGKPTFVMLPKPSASVTKSAVVVINASSGGKFQESQVSTAVTSSVSSPTLSAGASVLAEKTCAVKIPVTSAASKPATPAMVVIIRSTASSTSLTNTVSRSYPIPSSLSLPVPVVSLADGGPLPTKTVIRPENSMARPVPVHASLLRDSSVSQQSQAKPVKMMKLAPVKRDSSSPATGTSVLKTSQVLLDRWKLPVACRVPLTGQVPATKRLGVWTNKVCGIDCPGRAGVPPTLYCDMCMTVFHPECVGLSSFVRHIGYLCRPCRQLTMDMQASKYQLSTQLPPSDDGSSTTLPVSDQSTTATVPTLPASVSSGVTPGLVSATSTALGSTSVPAVTTTGIMMPNRSELELHSNSSPTCSATFATTPALSVGVMTTLTSAVASEKQSDQQSRSEQPLMVVDVEKCSNGLSSSASIAASSSESSVTTSFPETLHRLTQEETASSGDAESLGDASSKLANSLEKEQEVLTAEVDKTTALDSKMAARKSVDSTDNGDGSLDRMELADNDAECGGKTGERTTAEQAETSSKHNDAELDEKREPCIDEADKDDVKADGDGLKPAAEAEKTASAAMTDDKGDDSETSSGHCVKEEQLRQVVTLPADLLTYISLSRPITLSINDNVPVTVPTANIYTSMSGLRLLLPAGCLPAEYVSGSQLVCTVGPCAGIKPSNSISLSLTLCQ